MGKQCVVAAFTRYGQKETLIGVLVKMTTYFHYMEMATATYHVKFRAPVEKLTKEVK